MLAQKRIDALFSYGFAPNRSCLLGAEVDSLASNTRSAPFHIGLLKYAASVYRYSSQLPPHGFMKHTRQAWLPRMLASPLPSANKIHAQPKYLYWKRLPAGTNTISCGADRLVARRTRERMGSYNTAVHLLAKRCLNFLDNHSPNGGCSA